MNLQKFCLVSLLVLTPVGASASDATLKKAAPETIDWSGFYVGAQLGAGRLKTTDSDLSNWFEGFTATTSTNDTLGGLRAGYDYTSGNMLIGGLVEGSLASMNNQAQSTPSFYETGSELGFLGSVRLKLGASFDRVTLFATGGLSFAALENLYAESSEEVINSAESRTGYVAGLGASYAIRPNVSIEMDVSRYGFGKKTYELVVPDGEGTDAYWSFKDHVDTATVGLNYHF